MKRLTFKKFFGLFLPCVLIGFLILSVSLTFGTSDAGKALGSIEGILVIFIGIYLLFSSYLNPVVKRMFTSLASHMKKKAK